MRRTILILFIASIGIPVRAARPQSASSDTLFSVAKYLDYEQVADPQVAPDGTRIIYTRRYVNQIEDRWDAALWIMNSDGTRNRLLPQGSSARWSPDGARVAYLADGDPSGAQVFVRDMDASAATQITRV